MNKWQRLLVGGLVIVLILNGGSPQARAQDIRVTSGQDTRNSGGFTGSGVPTLAPVLGDFVNEGVLTIQRRTDIPTLIKTLQKMHAKDYMHMVWQEKRYPYAWADFQLMAPEFQKAGIRLWLYLMPPNSGAPEPFGGDYVRWATECAKIAAIYPAVAGICIDDFNGSVKELPPLYCQEMMKEAHVLAPHLALLVVCYYGYQKTIASHVESGSVDGVIFPYFYPHKNHSDTSKLLPQIEAFRRWLDDHTKSSGQDDRKMPLVVMIYSEKHSESQDSPTPAYVSKCLSIGLAATTNGFANGVITYCLPKDQPTFVEPVAETYKRWGTSKTPSR